MADEYGAMRVVHAVATLPWEELEALRKEGGDIPTRVVARALSIMEDEVTPMMRDCCKKVLFGYLYSNHQRLIDIARGKKNEPSV